MLPLTQLPTKTLHNPSTKVSKEDLASAKIQKFIQEMIPAMYNYQGIGLAAPQVAKNIQVCVVGKDADKSLKKDLVLINPTFEKLTKKTKTDTEGCLSVPGKVCKVKRSTYIRVTALDLEGNKIEFKAKNFFARVVQHELDHLQGVLIVDRAIEIFDVKPE